MSNIAQVPDHFTGDEFTEEMWASIEGNLNDGVVNQRGAKVHRTGNKAIGASATVTIDFDVVDVDAESMWDAATPTRLTIKTAGFYMGVGGLEFSADATGTQRLAHIVLNGTTDIGRNSRGPRDGSHAVDVQVTFLRYLSVGDFVELQATWDATAAGNMNSQTEYGNYLSICRL